MESDEQGYRTPKVRGNPAWRTEDGKGVSGNANGRPFGSTNFVKKEVRESYQKLVEMNIDNMSTWLAQVAAEDPHKALKIMIELSEYIIPKLARTELTGKDGTDFTAVTFNFGPPINSPDRIQD